ncbi:MAG: heme-binding protein [Rhizobium sp.]|nr:heme-binding protein [Rhizobium sp.]
MPIPHCVGARHWPSRGLPFQSAREVGSQVGSVEIATLKARTAVLYRRNTKDFQDVVEGEGRFALLCIPNGVPLDGGVLLKAGEEIIGAIGVSGASDEADGDIGRLGAAILSKQTKQAI